MPSTNGIPTIVYAQQAFPDTVQKTIFLAGPTPRSGDGISWRPHALQVLTALGFDGHVFYPEPADGQWLEDYEGQIEWERLALSRADVIVFWVPRDVRGSLPGGNGKPMAGLTTNDEWGMWKDSGKVVWGAPPWAENTRYQSTYAKKLGAPRFTSLEETLKYAVERLGVGAERVGDEAFVPLHLWKRDDFQAWYQSQTAQGNELLGLEVPWSLWVGPNKDRLMLYVIQPRVWVHSENREKMPTESLLIRSDISVICLYHAPPGALTSDTQVVLVQEYRAPVRNELGFVLELPGGSSAKPGTDPLQTAAEEVSEEVGLAISKDRLKAHGSRQMGATLVGYHAHLFSASLSADEMQRIAKDRAVHGADENERIRLHVKTVREIVDSQLVDWPMIGMLFQALVGT